MSGGSCHDQWLKTANYSSLSSLALSCQLKGNAWWCRTNFHLPAGHSVTSGTSHATSSPEPPQPNPPPPSLPPNRLLASRQLLPARIAVQAAPTSQHPWSSSSKGDPRLMMTSKCWKSYQPRKWSIWMWPLVLCCLFWLYRVKAPAGSQSLVSGSLTSVCST